MSIITIRLRQPDGFKINLNRGGLQDLVFPIQVVKPKVLL